MRYTIIIFLSFNLVFLIDFTKAQRPVVHTKLGTIRGVEASDGDYNMYMAVPYAKVNLSNPFGAAIPINRYENVIEADKDSLGCIQKNDIHPLDSIFGNLDCLELNIYAPKKANDTNPLPIMVYLYGGNLMRGYANRSCYGPRFLMKHDIVLITIEFRNGPYGFMCLDTPEVPGNQGLKDQLLALQWIQENIRPFGGDPDKVTLSGESSGSILTHFHYVYAPENLFHKIILASGTIMTGKMIEPSNKTIPLKIAEVAGLTTNSFTEAFDFIINMDPRLLVHINSKLGILYKPCIEKKFENVKNFVTAYPASMKKNREHMPILLGNTLNETKMFFENKNNNMTEYIQFNLRNRFDFGSDISKEMSQLVKSFYSEKYINHVEYEKQGLIFFSSDFKFLHPNMEVIKKGLKNKAKVFLYLFTYCGQRDYAKKRFSRNATTAIHADELGYVFDIKTSFLNQTYITREDQLMVDRFTAIWANFVKFGDPTPQTSDLLPIKWNPVTEKTLFCMVIDLKVNVIKRPFHNRMAFWDLFYDTNSKYNIYSDRSS